jgi:hypothetical protein
MLGKAGSVSQGLKYFESKFRDQIKNQPSELVVHFTCCNDTKNMKVIIENVLHTIFKKSLSEAGFAM